MEDSRFNRIADILNHAISSDAENVRRDSVETHTPDIGDADLIEPVTGAAAITLASFEDLDTTPDLPQWLVHATAQDRRTVAIHESSTDFPFSDVERQAHELADTVRSMRADLHEVYCDGIDDDGLVTARVNGNGHLLDIQIAAQAGRNLQKLGTRLAAAVERAKRAADERRHVEMDAAFPGMLLHGEMDDLLVQISRIQPEPLGSGGGAREARNHIAESLEDIKQLVSAQDAFRSRRFQQEIGQGIGSLEMDGTGKIVSIDIDSSTIVPINTTRLAAQVLTSCRSLSSRIEHERLLALQEVHIGGLSVGGYLQKAVELIGPENSGG